MKLVRLSIAAAAISAILAIGSLVALAAPKALTAAASPQSGAARAVYCPKDEKKRRQSELNAFIRTSGVFDSVIDFDAVILDPATGAMRAEFVPESTTGGPGDKLHPNRAGYLAMGMAIDLKALPAPELRP